MIQDTGFASAGWIAMDARAYAIGILTAAILGEGPPCFVTA